MAEISPILREFLLRMEHSHLFALLNEEKRSDLKEAVSGASPATFLKLVVEFEKQENTIIEIEKAKEQEKKAIETIKKQMVILNNKKLEEKIDSEKAAEDILSQLDSIDSSK